MRASELRELKLDQLEDQLEEAREEYFRLRFEFAVGALQDTSKLRIARREIARAATVLLERQRQQEGEE